MPPWVSMCHQSQGLKGRDEEPLFRLAKPSLRDLQGWVGFVDRFPGLRPGLMNTSPSGSTAPAVNPSGRLAARSCLGRQGGPPECCGWR